MGKKYYLTKQEEDYHKSLLEAVELLKNGSTFLENIDSYEVNTLIEQIDNFLKKNETC